MVVPVQLCPHVLHFFNWACFKLAPLGYYSGFHGNFDIKLQSWINKSFV